MNMGLTQVIFILYGLVHQAFGAALPKASGEVEASGSANIGIPPLLTFKDGNIGVNFLGFKASAGLGGLLTGDMSQGGLHAEAETPFGQKAGAGLGGRVDGNGRSVGGLYAGATAGGGVGAMAGLDGMAGADGSAGRSYAGASAGGVGKTVIKERFGPPAVATGATAPASSSASASFSGSLNVQKIGSPKPVAVKQIEIVKEVVPAKSKINIEVEKEVVAAPPPPPKKTYVERTVIPNYVEKTIQVPSYVEKTIRVPTVIEKKIRVPAPPTIIEKEIEVPEHVKTVTKTKHVVQNDVLEVPTATYVKTKTKIHRRPWLHLRKRFNIHSGETPYYGGVVANADTSANSAAAAGGGFGAFGNFGYQADYKPPPPVTYTATVRKQFNGNLIKDIFNIPIATLGAVSNLVGNAAGGANGSVSVSKSYGSYRK